MKQQQNVSKQPTERETERPAALEGIRVLDFSHQIAGPSATLTLALLGAEVVKVVSPKDKSSYEKLPFHLQNANKKSVVLDLKSDEGRETALKLVEKADIFVENFAPGVIHRLGLDYENLREINPGLIYAQIKGFPEGHEFESFPAFDPVAQAYSGSTSITGEADGLPLRPGPDLADTGSGQSLMIGVLAALVQRQATGEGQKVSVAMTDHIATFIRLHYSYPISFPGKGTPRAGNGGPAGEKFAPSGLFPTPPFGSDDYVQIHVGNDRQWVRFANAIGREDLAEDPSLATQAGRVSRVEEMDEITTAWSQQHSKIEAMRILGAAGVPVAALRNTAEVMEDPDLHERGVMNRVPHPDHGEAVIAGLPFHMSNSRVAVSPPAYPGSDTAEVLDAWLNAEK